MAFNRFKKRFPAFGLARSQAGFTLIELVIVLVILGILVTIVVVAHNGVVSENRNRQREADIETVQGALESYYAQYSVYPTLSDMNNNSWVAKYMDDLSSGNLQDPAWSSSASACSSEGHSILINKVSANCYSYQVISTAGSSCDDVHVDCAHYTLTAMLSDGVKYVKSSLN